MLHGATSASATSRPVKKQQTLQGTGRVVLAAVGLYGVAMAAVYFLRLRRNTRDRKGQVRRADLLKFADCFYSV